MKIRPRSSQPAAILTWHHPLASVLFNPNCSCDFRIRDSQIPSRSIWIFPRIGYPKMDGLKWKSLLKWMIWGYPYLWKHPYQILHEPTFDQQDGTTHLCHSNLSSRWRQRSWYSTAQSSSVKLKPMRRARPMSSRSCNNPSRSRSNILQHKLMKPENEERWCHIFKMDSW